MDFGRLTALDGVSFTLPPLPERSARLLSRGSLDAPAAAGDWLYVGAPAWARRDWLGKLYPRGTTPREFLRCYARSAGAIELNASFYNVPELEILDGWLADTPARFRFCPKLHQDISHTRGLRDVATETRQFCERFLHLGDRLGPALLQLPPWFAPDRRATLDAFLACWPRQLAIAVELRHEAWFAHGTLTDPAIDLLEKHGAAAVITDVAGRRDACHATLTTPATMIRFVGNALHATDRPRVEAWIDRLIDWHARGLARAFFFVHQPDDLLAPELMAHAIDYARSRGVAHPPMVLGDPQQALFQP